MPVVGLVISPHTMLYETAIAAEVFGTDRSELSPTGAWYELVAFTQDGLPVPWLPTATTRPFSALRDVDTVVVPSIEDVGTAQDPALVLALRGAHAAGARIVALCTGAFVLAEAGLLDGHEAATHWMHAQELALRYPRVKVRAEVLFVDDGQVLTSAGKTAALDLCLHLVRLDHGAAAANALARRLVVPAHRPGGQAQFIDAPPDPPADDGLGPALTWALTCLDQPLTVADMSRRAGLSTRQLARRMNAELGMGPLAWLQGRRIKRAQDLLERTDATVEQIASSCGFGTAATLRRRFRVSVGVSPTAYRETFRR